MKCSTHIIYAQKREERQQKEEKYLRNITGNFNRKKDLEFPDRKVTPNVQLTGFKQQPQKIKVSRIMPLNYNRKLNSLPSQNISYFGDIFKDISDIKCILECTFPQTYIPMK